jgi:hypothetical protein
MKKILFLSLFAWMTMLSVGQVVGQPSGQSVAQSSTTTTGTRYLDPVFTEWITVSGEYQPGYAFTIYMPTKDTEDKRPVIIFYTGGGTTDIGSLAGQCIEACKLGYVTVAAQYKKTIGDGFTESEQKDAVIHTYTLIKYLRDNSVSFGIKKKKMFGYGVSAGAITWINAGITANNTDIPFYSGIEVPKIKHSLLATCSNSGAAIGAYFYLIAPGGAPNNFFNGGKDLLIDWNQANATYKAELAAGIPSLFHLYPLSGHGVGEHDDLWYNPDYGMIPTFYKYVNPKKQPQP